METIKFTCKGKKYLINMYNKSYEDFSYMNDLKLLKKRTRFAILHNQEDIICRYSFVSSNVNSDSYVLIRVNENVFEVVDEWYLKYDNSSTF